MICIVLTLSHVIFYCSLSLLCIALIDFRLFKQQPEPPIYTDNALVFCVISTFFLFNLLHCICRRSLFYVLHLGHVFILLTLRFFVLFFVFAKTCTCSSIQISLQLFDELIPDIRCGFVSAYVASNFKSTPKCVTHTS